MIFVYKIVYLVTDYCNLFFNEILIIVVISDIELCSSRKFPSSPHRRDFFLSPHTPLEILIKLYALVIGFPEGGGTPG